jgi:uncharacterized protein (TIGR02001 family)
MVGLELSAQAEDRKLTLSGSATLTTDYIFRGISNTNRGPAVQSEFDLGYGIFYAYAWGSNTAFGDGIEIDYGAGITPSWAGIDFDIGILGYTFPGANDIDYLELTMSAARTFDRLTLSIGNWWSPDNFGLGIQSNAIELSAAYAFDRKLWNFFTPSISAGIGWQWYEAMVPDYTYWNAGMTLGFLERWSADLRYYDTDYNRTACVMSTGRKNNCDARLVGAIKATF